MQVRRATLFDVSTLAAMLFEMHKNTEIKTSKINPEKLIGKINEAIHRGVVLIAHENNIAVGSIAGMTACDWWSDEKYFSDLWFYVKPESRKSKAASLLVTSFIKIGNEAKLPIRLGHIFSGDLDRKDKFFERLGLSKAGSVYVEN
tara:strand:+ start:1486 stop:1923 length:438 start_codon:yes stop_codon:yes gene_type:complete